MIQNQYMQSLIDICQNTGINPIPIWQKYYKSYESYKSYIYDSHTYFEVMHTKCNKVYIKCLEEIMNIHESQKDDKS